MLKTLNRRDREVGSVLRDAYDATSLRAGEAEALLPLAGAPNERLVRQQRIVGNRMPSHVVDVDVVQPPPRADLAGSHFARCRSAFPCKTPG